MAESRERTLIKWVCSECGSNNMCHKAVIYQCMVCGKIHSDEPIFSVNGDKVINPPIAEVKISLDNYWYEYFIITFDKVMHLIAKTLSYTLVFLTSIYVISLFVGNESLYENFINIQNNLQILTNCVFLRVADNLLQHCYTCYSVNWVNICSNSLLVKNAKRFIDLDMVFITWNNIGYKFSIIRSNNRLIQTAITKKWMNIISITPIIWMHIENVFADSITNIPIYFKKVYMKIIETKKLIERKLFK